MAKGSTGKLGFWSIVLFGINGVIGTGIFLMPNLAYKQVGTVSVLLFIFVALLVLTIALSIAENASMFKADGGTYLYAKEAFGDFVGYEIGFMNWIVQMIILSTVLSAFVTALGGVSRVFTEPLVKNTTMIAATLLLILLNLSGIKLTKYISNIMTVFKLLPLVLFIAMGIFFIQGGQFQPVIVPELTAPKSLVQGIFIVYYAFGGFESLPLVAAEMEDPEHNLPKALITIIGVVSAFYILLQIVSIGILGPNLSTAVLPVQTAFAKIMGPFGSALVAAGTLVSSAGAAIAISFWTPRPGMAMADNGMLPKVLSRRSKKDVPYVAVLVSLLLTMAIALSGSFAFLASIISVLTFIIYISTTISVMVFRRTKKDTPRAFKLKGGVTIPLIATVFSVVLLFGVTIHQAISALVVILLAIPFYAHYRYRIKKAQ